MTIEPNPLLTVFRYPVGDGPEFVIHEPTQNRTLKVAEDLLLRIIAASAGGITQRDLVYWLNDSFGVEYDEAESLCQELLDSRILIDSADPPEFETYGFDWHEYGWTDALGYYVSNISQEYIEHEASMDKWKHRIEDAGIGDEQVETNYKRYPEADTVELPPPEESDEPFDTVFADYVRGNFEPADSPMSRRELSNLLFFTFGETGRLLRSKVGESLLKTSPSAGALHPTEAYVVVDDVQGVEEGIYHYSVADHALESLGDRTDEMFTYIPGSRVDVSVGIVLTSVVYRSMLKYPAPKAFQTINQDVGHLVETLRILTHMNGRRTRYGVPRDLDAVERLLGIDTFEEPVFGHVVVE